MEVPRDMKSSFIPFRPSGLLGITLPQGSKTTDQCWPPKVAEDNLLFTPCPLVRQIVIKTSKHLCSYSPRSPLRISQSPFKNLYNSPKNWRLWSSDSSQTTEKGKITWLQLSVVLWGKCPLSYVCSWWFALLQLPSMPWRSCNCRCWMEYLAISTF